MTTHVCFAGYQRRTKAGYGDDLEGEDVRFQLGGEQERGRGTR